MNAPHLLPPEASLADAPPVMPDEPVLPLSVEAYHALLQAGILQSGDPIELLEGFLVRKMTKGHRHESTRRRLRRLLEKLIANGYLVDEQGAMTTRDSEPEPDVFVVRGTLEDFDQRHPGLPETVLVAEVAESSLRRDKGLKRRIYARASVPEYWVVNLIDDCIEVYSQPSGPTEKPAYAETKVYRPGELVPVVLDGQTIGQIAVADVLAPAAPRGEQG